jgi:DNA-binding CsgD family transcriptional regulator/tetratricopeptide (TPR) repeat protein
MMLGRIAERATVDELLRSAREGRSGSLVITGEAGIGKSTLLDYAVDQAVGSAADGGERLTVLRARGYESESAIPFAGLSDLLQPVIHVLPELPDPQAAALSSALSLGPPVGGDRFSVCAATLGMLASAAEESPLLVVVDDLHWLDQSTREAVLFAARRLHAEGIALLLASRERAGGGDLAGIAELPLGGIDRSAADEMFTRLAPHAPPDVRQQIYDDADGNPLGIRELTDQLGRRAPAYPGVGMPSDSRLVRAVRERVTGLPEGTREALMLVAASSGAERDVVLRAAQLSGVHLASFAPAEEAGLLGIDDRRIQFRHPLLRSVFYASGTAYARAAAHAALAQVLAEVPGDAAADARAWHLAQARVAPDEETAAALDAAAQRARRRGAYLEAARAAEEGARFGTAELRPARLLRAARAWQLAGRTGRVLELMEEALPLAQEPHLRALIRHMDAYVRMWRRQPADGCERMLAGAAEIEDLDPGRAALMYADAGIACFMLARTDEILRLGRRAYDLSRGGGGSTELIATVAFGVALALHGERREAGELLAGCLDELWASDPIARAQEYAHAAYALMWLEDYDQAEKLLDRLVARGRAVGAVGILPQALAMVADLYFRLGRWPESRAAGEEGVTLAEESRQPNAYGRYFVARLDSLQGRAPKAEQMFTAMIEIARRYGAGVIDPYVMHSRGLVALAKGDVTAAVAHLEDAGRTPLAEGIREPSVVPWAYDLVEAYARAGRTDDAEKLLARTAPAPGDETQRWAHAVTARCRGLLATSRADSTAAFAEALTWHARDERPFEKARTQLCYGERLRRDRQRAQARQPLREALAIFERLEAVDWAARTRHELAATGADADQPAAEGVVSRLTPQELQVASVVARGASNAEAATALFLSQKTIEYHLSNVYRKTGITSRSELAALMSTTA